jgi:predicted MFS family arabinose efflux permease
MAEARPTGGIRGALAHRDFRLLLGGQAISNTGDWLYNVALVVYVLEVTGSGAWVAATNVVRFLPYVLFGTLGGVIADRYDRKKVMIVADLARAGIMSGLTLVAASDGSAVWAIALATASTTFSSAYLPSIRAATPTLVGEDDLAAANTLTSTIENAALALGPAVGGVLLLLGSPTAAFGVNAASFVVSAAFTASIRTSLVPKVAGDEAPTPFGERLRAGFRAIRSSSTVQVLLALSIGFTIFYGQEIVLYALASGELFEIGDDGLAFLWAAIGAGGIAAAGITSRIAARPRQAAILGFVSVLSAVPIALLAFVHAPALVYPLVAIEGATVIVGDVIFMTMMQRAVSSEVLGRVFGIMDSLMVLGILLGTVLAPVLVELAGLEVAMVAAGGLVVLITAVAWPRARAVDREAAARAVELAERVALFERTEMFEGGSRTALEALAASAARKEIAAGTVVVREGDPADDLFVIESGRALVTALGRRSAEDSLDELGTADHFGEIGVIERRPRTATVTAASDCIVYRIGGDDFLRAVGETPRMSGRLLSTVATRLARTHPELVPVDGRRDSEEAPRTGT